ncbi:conserved membrane hypothetical protein [Planktothrix paucivesiculata PCC 9631]|uniref:NACHT domain-containing protein n=1 Tax=Planktothrix paucivesiculata PCC 9631 TaxID=671071 RepID=A0A7Z9BEQ6_9CYAN|nr:conserved membrane hypothetical protein [Planktothrix paucivesiculata PCC 9631]
MANAIAFFLDYFNIDTNIFLGLTIASVILIGFLSSQSTNSFSPAETNSPHWLVGFVPIIGSVVLFCLLKSSLLPTNLIQYVGLAFLFLFVAGTILPVLIVCLDVWRGNKSPAPVNGGKDSRQVLLNVMKTEVAKRLQDNLHYQTKIDLLTEDQPELVNRPQNLKPLKPKNKPKWNILSLFGKTQTEVPETEKVINIFNRSDIAGRLLILGDPGSGKTTTLLELAKDLLAKTQEPNNQIIPFIFELSSWKDDKLSIADWLAADLNSRFKIPESETKNWIKTGQLLPLLDGLDELGLTQQTQCITKIDQCLQEHPDLQVAVCCRVQEYQTGEVNFEKLRWAISIQPLTDAQIKNYLQELNRADLWQSIQTDPEGLLKLAKIPLLLHLIPVAYPEGYLQPNLGRQRHNQQYLEDSRNQLLAAYIDRQLEKNHSRYSAKDTKRWLQWLARQLRERNQAEFLLEKMQPDLLGSSKYKLIYRLMVGLILGLILGLKVGLIFGLIFSLILGLKVGLMVGLIFGLISGLSNSEIEPAETNNTIAWSLPLISGFGLALVFSIFLGGDMAVIEHYTLRFVLWCSGATPLNYVDFLSYAAERPLIQQVGGRYRFIHDLLREYLAGVQPWRCTCTLTGHADIVWDVALSPDGKTIASASNDNTVKLWRLSA